MPQTEVPVVDAEELRVAFCPLDDVAHDDAEMMQQGHVERRTLRPLHLGSEVPRFVRGNGLVEVSAFRGHGLQEVAAQCLPRVVVLGADETVEGAGLHHADALAFEPVPQVAQVGFLARSKQQVMDALAASIEELLEGAGSGAGLDDLERNRAAGCFADGTGVAVSHLAANV